MTAINFEIECRSCPSELPRRKPLLDQSRVGAAFMVALIVVCALAPVLNLWVPDE